MLSLICAGWLIVYVFMVLQDYLYSSLRSTAFFLHECILFNIHWLLFIPLSWFYFLRLSKQKFDKSSKWTHLFKTIVFSVLITIFQMVLFSCIVFLLSNLFFNPPHRFSRIFVNILSNDTYITLLYYCIFPYLIMYGIKLQPKQRKGIDQLLIRKSGNRLLPIDVATIQCFTSSKPYTAVHTTDSKYLTDKSLNELEQLLDPDAFIRVHKSSILNRSAIVEMNSRQNGDYDARLKNDQIVRLSRHYRKNWKELIHST